MGETKVPIFEWLQVEFNRLRLLKFPEIIENLNFNTRSPLRLAPVIPESDE